MVEPCIICPYWLFQIYQIVTFKGCPSLLPVLQHCQKKMIENIIRKAIELIVEPSMTCCSQIDSSKFMRAPLEQLLPITKDAHHCKWQWRVWCCCLGDTEAMNLLNNEMYDKVDDKEKQMDFSQIQPERRDIWGNSKARYLVEFQSFSLSHQHSYVAMKTYKKKYIIDWWKTKTNRRHMWSWTHTKKWLSYSDGRQKQMECYFLNDL